MGRVAAPEAADGREGDRQTAGMARVAGHWGRDADRGTDGARGPGAGGRMERVAGRRDVHRDGDCVTGADGGVATRLGARKAPVHRARGVGGEDAGRCGGAKR
jgi:hypothetical protein